MAKSTPLEVGVVLTGDNPLSEYVKAIVAIVAAALAVLGSAMTDDQLTSVEVVNVALAFVTATGVYLVPNLPTGPGRYAKAIVAVVGGGGQVLVLILSDGLGFTQVTIADWITVLLAAIAALGVGVLPNAKLADVEPLAMRTPACRLVDCPRRSNHLVGDSGCIGGAL